jgi:cation-transporting ATPase E
LKFLRKKEERQAQTRPPLDVIEAPPERGLTAADVERRRELGYANTPVDPPGKTVKQIIFSNVFTFFNLIFFLLAACIIAVRSWNNLMFMGVVICNTVIGIVQELRSKRTLDQLNLLTAPQGSAVRDGKLVRLNTAELVRDDVVVFRRGDQIYADAAVLSGTCQVNEALITGEADEIRKGPGDRLLSGSFLVSGECYARLTAVGADSYASRLTLEAKRAGKPKQSEMMRSLTALVKWIGVIIIPLGAILCVKEIVWLGRSVTEGVVSTVAALIGMIPEGLYLLTSLALVASILRLAQKKTLVHEMSCIETLARVDTLCVDKTGTITENKMIVDSVHPLCPDRYNESDIGLIMADYVAAMHDDNDTMAALRGFFTGEIHQQAIAAMPFTSAKKYGGVSFHEDETYVLGAPDVMLGERYGAYAELIDGYAAKGCRVLLLADYSGQLSDEKLTGALLPLALILLNNKIRAEAPDTFRYFAAQGVAVKVISGDNPLTVSEVAKRAGIEGAERCVDARTLTDDALLEEAAGKYTVFGRVTPAQKRKLVQALKRQKHIVAMTGDGVNDVLALKEADCSVAMASGSDAACHVSNIVLLNSDFSAMPGVVAEGRRVINNIERSATLFLVKNIFSFTLAIVSLIFTMPYPFSAAQLSLVSSLTIGFPAFVLAMEPNESLISGRFLRNVLSRALPAAMTDFVLIIGIMLFYYAFQLDSGMMSTICAITMGIVGIFVIIRQCRPWTLLRKLLVAAVVIAFVFCAVFMKSLFTLSPLDFAGMLLLLVFAALAYPALKLAYHLKDLISEKVRDLLQRKKTKNNA